MVAVVVNGPASWNTLVRLDALPDARPQTLAARSAQHGLGGTSAGKAVTLAALGVEVLLATVLGDDEPAAAGFFHGRDGLGEGLGVHRPAVAHGAEVRERERAVGDDRQRRAEIFQGGQINR